jgi:hypothetical protein
MGWFSRLGIRTPVMAELTAVLLLVACSGYGGNEAADQPRQDVGEPGQSPATIGAGLVGMWERQTRCQELVAALTEAGLERWILEGVAGNGFVPGVRSPDEIADPEKPCKGSVPRTHSHFFTEDGRFGSLDWNGDQVDDGTFELVGDDTFVVSKEFPNVTFHYAIDGDSIRFEPVIPDCSPDCFEAAWSVSVAYPGETWVRVG